MVYKLLNGYGNGIEQELIPKIFDRFTRGSDVPDNGSGLGLGIAKRIIDIIISSYVTK